MVYAASSPIRLLQVLPSLESGGVERGTVDIAIAAKKAGIDSFVVSGGGKMTYQLKKAGVEHIELPVNSKNPFVMWRNIGRIKRIIEEKQITLVHARSRAPGWSAYLAVKSLKKAKKHSNLHFITTFHGTYNQNGRFKRKYNSVMTKGERVIAISNFVAEHIRTQYGVDEAKIVMIPRGADPKIFDRQSVIEYRVTQLLEKWGAPDNLPIILLPGRITRWKGQELLIDALSSLPHRNFFCMIVGDDKHHIDYRISLEKRIADKNLQGHVRIANHVQDIAAAYKAAAIVVSASVEPEAFGRVSIEAQMMGVPTIATKHGGSLETIIETPESKRTGWLVEPTDVPGLAATLHEVLHLTAEERNRISTNATRHAIEQFDNAFMIEKTLTLYRELSEAA